MRRFFGVFFILAGACLLLAVGYAYGASAIARRHVRASWTAVEANGSLGTPDSDVSHRSFARGEPVGRIDIPSIDLDEVFIEGVGDAQLAIAPGHLPQSALPGEPGNAVISAHRDRQFHALDKLSLGDTIVTETYGGRTTWVIVARRIVERGKPALFATVEPTLTLTTCWPVRYVGPAPDRLIITAKVLERARRGV
ncbi:MAG TPA: class D sortase [Gemmatimonadaceae bacterium]|nr:class D sortase [Gemmatimonadaceae bacterium]